MWSRPGAATAAMLGTAAVVLACHLTRVPWWAPAGAGFGLASFTLPGILAGLNSLRWAYAALCLAAAGGWSSWATWTLGQTGITPLVGISAPVLAAGLSLLSLLLPPVVPTHAPRPTQTISLTDDRPERVRSWEALLRRLTQQAITVTTVTDWDNGAGERVAVLLPERYTVRDLADLADTIASAPALRLPQGCTVQIADGPLRCSAVVDVMTRDCLADYIRIDEPTTPARITDSFQLMTSPRGEELTGCLRIQSMIVGGTIGSGKTTFLHRLIFFLARCTDSLIWVVDTNGGGLAEPWVSMWAQGRADRPVVDWVADTEAEAAVLVATARAIARDRKTSREATRRCREANTTVLPVDASLPAIVVIADEGGELRQAKNLLGALVVDGLDSIAQIGRAAGVRLVLSVLRGTADLLSKGARVVCGLRVCLRMDEEGEADHILGRNPGRTHLTHVGSGWLYRTTQDQRPILGRTVDVLLDTMDAHSIACARHRPLLDERGQRIAARIVASDVLGGRNPADYPDLARLRPIQDADAGRGYAGRWDRYAGKLAQMRGEDPPEEADAPEMAPASAITPGSALEALAAGTGVLSKATATMPAGGPASDQAAPTAKETIVEIVRHAHPNSVTSAQIGEGLVAVGVGVARQYRQDLLSELVTDGRLARVQDRFGHYSLGGRELQPGSAGEAV